jgi:hypothetical protein
MVFIHLYFLTHVNPSPNCRQSQFMGKVTLSVNSRIRIQSSSSDLFHKSHLPLTCTAVLD